MPIIAKNTTAETIAFPDLSGFNITASGTETLSDYFTVAKLSQSDDLSPYISSGDIVINDGVSDLSASNGLKLCYGTVMDASLTDEYRDRSGKLRVHQTSRKLGLRIMWTGDGDDPTDPHAVGGGESLTFEFNTTSGTPEPIYIDFNAVDNETWLHEGYLTWKNCHFEKLTLKMVPNVTGITASSGTNYDLYGGYLVTPAYPGTGAIDITTDITEHSGGLVYMPDNDLGEAPTAFWNADWNTTTKEYENITAAPYGNGRYNMFAAEVTLARFINKIPMLANGFIALNSSDTDQMGHGMRLKMSVEVGDHNGDEEIVGIACIMCMHREKSV